MRVFYWIKKVFKYVSLTILVGIIAFVIYLLIPNKYSDFNIEPRSSTQYWELGTGSRIAYTHIKPEIDTIQSTLIYVHGGPGGYIGDGLIEIFQKIAQKGYEVYLYDQVGSGLSKRLSNPKEYTVNRHSNDLKEIIETLSPKSTVLIGQSWGGFLATYFTANNIELVDGLILTSPGEISPVDSLLSNKYKDLEIPGLNRNDERIDRLNQEMENELSVKEKAWLVLGRLTGNTTLISDNKVDGVLQHLSEIFISGMGCDTINVKKPKGGRPGMYSSMFTTKSKNELSEDIRPKIKKINKSVLVLKGECDYIDLEQTYEYVDLMPNAKLEIIENAGHSIYKENEDKYINNIITFMLNNIQTP